jgi:hypothetical protein
MYNLLTCSCVVLCNFILKTALIVEWRHLLSCVLWRTNYVSVKLSMKLLVKCKLSWWSTQWSENCLGEAWWWAKYVLTMVRCNLAITWGNSSPQIYISIFHGCGLTLQSLHCFWKNSTILTFSDKYNTHPNFSLPSSATSDST